MARFSSYSKIVRMLAWVKRFIQNARTESHLREKGEITASEYDIAEKLLIRFAQCESFEGNTDRRLKELNVYIDDFGLVRTKTLILNREDDFDFRYPAVMDPKHPLTTLLIEHTHKRLKHAGINTMMTSLRGMQACRRIGFETQQFLRLSAWTTPARCTIKTGKNLGFAYTHVLCTVRYILN